jgi:hypothetical protein
MHHEIPELDRSGLRRFALKMGGVIAALFGLVLPWLFSFKYPLWPWIVAGVLSAWGLVAPGTLGPVYHAWMRIGIAIGWFNSKVILGVLFYTLILPAGLIMRLFGKDPMRRKLRTSDSTYRVPSKNPAREHLERPY